MSSDVLHSSLFVLLFFIQETHGIIHLCSLRAKTCYRFLFFDKETPTLKLLDIGRGSKI